jgi:hypothetical protein
VMREARIAMRTVDAVRKNEDVSDEGLKRMAAAVERIESRSRSREVKHVEAIAWLKAKREEMGLTGLAKLTGLDAANLGKVIDGRRKAPASIIGKLASFDRG